MALRGSARSGWGAPVPTYVILVMIAVGFLAAAVRAAAAVRRDRLRWDFFRHVYDKGGRRDLTAAAEALEHREEDP
jgi:hypothetical protein